MRIDNLKRFSLFIFQLNLMNFLARGAHNPYKNCNCKTVNNLRQQKQFVIFHELKLIKIKSYYIHFSLNIFTSNILKNNNEVIIILGKTLCDVITIFSLIVINYTVVLINLYKRIFHHLHQGVQNPEAGPYGFE